MENWFLLNYPNFQISFTYTRNKSGPNTLPCNTPDVTLTSSNIFPLTLTLCIRPKSISLTLTTTLSSTPEVAIFVSSWSRRIKSQAFEKCFIIASNLVPLCSESAMSWQTEMSWLSHEYPGWKPCWPSYNQSCLSQTCLGYDAIMCSACLKTTEVKLTELQFVTSDRSPPL